MRWLIGIGGVLFIVGLTWTVVVMNTTKRKCELAGGVVMQHRNTTVCVAREGLRILPIEPEIDP